jgi:SAM-dependent methyltransferase
MKSWKRLQYIYGLKKLEVQNDNSIGLGMDVGHEPLIYFFCSKVKHIVTTDICDEKSIGMAAAKEGDPEILSDVDKFAPFPYKKERLEIKRMKGRKLEFPENTFVFIWSCSSIEHFGGHEEAAKSIKEMERVLKHSGFLALATEFVIHQDIITGFKSEHPYFFNLEALYKYLIASHNLKSVQNINFSLSAYYIKIYIKLPEESQSPHMSMHRKPHIALCQGNVLFTSIFLFFRKGV